MANQAHPVLETILAARRLLEREKWLVDNSNCLAAILAVKAKQPSELHLVSRDDAPEKMEIEVFEEIFRGTITEACRTTLRFVDSFCSPRDTDVDKKRLNIIKAKESVKLIRFYGYLDGATIDTLPKTISSLGLAIRSEKDARGVGSLQPWDNLKRLNVSVSRDVAVGDLMPLNKSLDEKEIFLTFPYLTNECVDNVTPAIYALTPNITLFELYFPKLTLTAAGVMRLASKLRPEKKPAQINLDLCGTWKPNEEEKKRIKEAFAHVVENVNFDVNWLYEER